NPGLLGEDPNLRITLTLDPEKRSLMVEDNGIGMSRAEMEEALGTIARSGTRAFVERIEAEKSEGVQLIGQFGIGFYSAFMVADGGEGTPRRAGTGEAALWSSDGKGTYSIAQTTLEEAPHRGTRVLLHLKEDAGNFAERSMIERTVSLQSGHVPVPI